VECSFVLPDRAVSRGPGSPAAEATMPRGGWSVGRIVLIGLVSFALTLAVVYLLTK
jgi:hypothetical protein